MLLKNNVLHQSNLSKLTSFIVTNVYHGMVMVTDLAGSYKTG